MCKKKGAFEKSVYSNHFGLRLLPIEERAQALSFSSRRTKLFPANIHGGMDITRMNRSRRPGPVRFMPRCCRRRRALRCSRGTGLWARRWKSRCMAATRARNPHQDTVGEGSSSVDRMAASVGRMAASCWAETRSGTPAGTGTALAPAHPIVFSVFAGAPST